MKTAISSLSIGPFMQIAFGLLLGYGTRAWLLRGEKVTVCPATIEFIKSHFDKLMLLFLIVFFMFYQMAMLIRFPNIDAAWLQWVEKSADMVLGALIAIVTSSLAMRRSESAMETVTQKPDGAVETTTQSAGKTEIGAPPLSPAEAKP